MPPNDQQQPPVAPSAVGSNTVQLTPADAQKRPSQTPKTAPNTQNTTQNSLLISEMRDSMVIMGDGSFRAVIACKSINFDLMSSREREGVEFSYQNFFKCAVFSGTDFYSLPTRGHLAHILTA